MVEKSIVKTNALFGVQLFRREMFSLMYLHYNFTTITWKDDFEPQKGKSKPCWTFKVLCEFWGQKYAQPMPWCWPTRSSDDQGVVHGVMRLKAMTWGSMKDNQSLKVSKVDGCSTPTNVRISSVSRVTSSHYWNKHNGNPMNFGGEFLCHHSQWCN